MAREMEHGARGGTMAVWLRTLSSGLTLCARGRGLLLGG